jgi:hypothetical protein
MPVTSCPRLQSPGLFFWIFTGRAKWGSKARSDAMAQAVLQAARSLGFAATLQGQGLIEI